MQITRHGLHKGFRRHHKDANNAIIISSSLLTLPVIVAGSHAGKCVKRGCNWGVKGQLFNPVRGHLALVSMSLRLIRC